MFSFYVKEIAKDNGRRSNDEENEEKFHEEGEDDEKKVSKMDTEKRQRK